MDLWDLTKMLVRRWYVFLPMLIASLVAVYFVTQSVRPDYRATGHVQLIPPPAVAPSAATNAKSANPWIDLGYLALGSAVALQVQNENVLKNLVAEGDTDSFTVAIQYGTTYFTIEAVGHSPAQATATVQQIMKLLAQLVASQQERFGVPVQQQITTLSLDNGDDVQAVTTKKKRVLVVALGISILSSAGLSIGLDALLRRRRRWKLHADETAVDAGSAGSMQSMISDVSIPAQSAAGPRPKLVLRFPTGSNGTKRRHAGAPGDQPTEVIGRLNDGLTAPARPAGIGDVEDGQPAYRWSVAPDPTIVLPTGRDQWSRDDGRGTGP